MKHGQASWTQLGENDFTDFVRYQHNSHRPLVSKKELFKSVRQLYRTPENAHG